MVNFSYTARDKKGVTTSGLLEALDKETAAQVLAERGLTPITIAEKKASVLRSNPLDILLNIRPIPSLEKVIFARQLATMINAGLPLVQAISILSQQTANPKMKKVLADLTKSVEGGTSLSISLAKHPKVFSNLFVSIIKAGEIGGFMDEVLERLATQLEKDHELTSKLRGAMVYPIVIIIAMVAVSTLTLTLVIPKLAQLFLEAGVQLPVPTKILIFSSDLLVKYWYIVFPVLIISVLLLIRGARTKKGKRIADRIILKVPVFGKLIKKISLARFNRTLASLMSSGIAVLDAIDITADAVGNTKYTDAIKNIGKRVRVGIPMAEPMKESPLFPPLQAQMVSVGEKTGTLDKILEKLAVFYENEVDRIVNNLTTILEPLIILGLGVAVAFLVIALILPILQISTTI